MTIPSPSPSREPLAPLVDDEPIIRIDDAGMVEEEGFTVVQARMVEDAYGSSHSLLRSIL